MVVLNKLKIKGIRSYSPDNTNVISFDSPLTMILGPNGSGKTTIIEALKYITTGELPTNTRGGAFVNDPKLQQKYINTAVVSLEFRNAMDETIQIKRTLQVTVKNNTLTQKTVETTLSILNNENWDVKVVKSADIDVGLLDHFGVSQSLLQNVIFCHQEEANWILSEPINVKKKLDDIFATTKYSKALDGLKKLKKETCQLLKIRNVELVAATEKKLKKERLVSDIESTRINIRDIENKLMSKPEIEIDYEIDNLKTLIEIEKNKEKEYLTINYQIQLIEGKLKEDDNLRSFEELRLFIISLDTFTHESKNITAKKELSFLYMESTVNNSLCFSNIEEINQFIAGMDLKYCQNNLDERKSSIQHALQNINRSLKNFTDISLQLPHIFSNLETVLNSIIKIENENYRIKISINDFAGENVFDYEKYLLDLEKIDAYLDEKSEIMDLQIKLKTLELQKGENTSLMQETKSNIKMRENQLIKLNDELKLLRLEMDELTNYIPSNNLIYDEESVLLQKTQLSKHLKDLENNLQESLLKNKITQIRKDNSDKKRYLKDELINKHDTFNIFLKDLSTFQNSYDIELSIESVYDFKSFLDLDSSMIYKTKNDLIALLNDKNYFKKLISELKSDIKELSKSGKILLLSDLFIINEQNADGDINHKIEETNRLITLSECAKVLFLNFDKKGSNRNVCYLCERNLDSLELVKYRNHICKTIGDLDIKINDLNKLKEDYAKELQKHDENMHENLKLDRIKIKIKHILHELAEKLNYKELEDVLASQNWNKENNNLELDKFMKDLHFRIEFNNLENLIEGLDDIIFLFKSKNELLLKYNDISVDNNTFDFIDIEKIKKEIIDVQSKINSCDNLLLQIQKERFLYEKVKNKNHLESKIQQIELDIVDINQIISEDQNLLNSFIKSQNQLEECIKSELCRFEYKSKEYTTKIEERRKNMMKLTFDIKSLKNNENSQIQRIQNYNEIYKNYKSILGDQIEYFNLEKLNDELLKDCKNLQSTLKDCHNKNMTLCFSKLSELNKIKDLINADFDKNEELIKNLYSLQKYKNSILERENLNQLKSKILIFKFENLKEYEVKLNALLEHRDIVLKQRYSLEGELKQLQQNIKKYNYSLSNDFENIDLSYNKLYVEIKTMEILINDIEKSVKALDISIVEYYKSKIEDINLILKDLWINTYKGNDIDFVELKNEVSDNKTYNYKLVMIKNGVELDMRGRCSAGQKVLTGILVRLALCDAFCASCFIIGLDEPTTNLDRENIESLALTINRVVEERNKDSNFQLVLITHDESFAEMISQQGCGSFYKVYKDRQGNSQIKMCVKNDYK